MIKILIILLMITFSPMGKSANPICEKYPNHPDSVPMECFNFQWRPGSGEPFYYVDNPACGKKIILPNCINRTPWTEIPEGAFKNLGLTHVEFGVFIKKIGDFAFQNNQLKELTLPGSFELENDFGHSLVVGEYAFENNQIEVLNFSLKPADLKFCKRTPINSEIKFYKYSFANNKIKRLNFTSSFKHSEINWVSNGGCAPKEFGLPESDYDPTFYDGLLTIWNFFEGSFQNNQIEHITFKNGIPVGFYLDMNSTWQDGGNPYIVVEKNIFRGNKIKEIVFNVDTLSYSRIIGINYRHFGEKLNFFQLFENGLADRSYLKIKSGCQNQCDTILKTFDPVSENTCFETCPGYYIYDIHNKKLISHQDEK